MGTKGVNDKAFALYEELKLRVSNDSNRVAIYKRRHAEKNKPLEEKIKNKFHNSRNERIKMLNEEQYNEIE